MAVIVGWDQEWGASGDREQMAERQEGGEMVGGRITCEPKLQAPCYMVPWTSLTKHKFEDEIIGVPGYLSQINI